MTSKCLGLLTFMLIGCANAGSTQEVHKDDTVDLHLGNRKAELKKSLEARPIGGRFAKWDEYVQWGRELVTTGQVQKPPVGSAPSPLLSNNYRCVHCHNLQREDVKLTVQDPEAREKLVRTKNDAKPYERDGQVLSLTPGTTLWGAVNREKFYNGHYAKYHRLRVAGGRQMDPASLTDAIQICCQYCSTGRFPETWELDSIHAFLWTLELRVSDLGQGDAARGDLKPLFLTVAGATRVDPPTNSDNAADTYATGLKFTGSADRGKLLYVSACAGCHGSTPNKLVGRELNPNAKHFHRYVWQGTEGDDTYMPFFPAERLSRQQAADIRIYLLSLPK